MQQPSEEVLKIVIIGEAGTGKSALTVQFTEERFVQDYKLTIGVEFGVKTIQVNDKNIKLQIWDVAGEDSFGPITTTYYRKAHLFFVVADLSRSETITATTGFIDDVRRSVANNPVIFIVGNKSDILAGEKNDKKAREIAKDLEVQYFAVSAKERENVGQLFVEGAKRVLEQLGKQLALEKRMSRYSQLISVIEVTLAEEAKKAETARPSTFLRSKPMPPAIVDLLRTLVKQLHELSEPEQVIANRLVLIKQQLIGLKLKSHPVVTALTDSINNCIKAEVITKENVIKIEGLSSAPQKGLR